MAQYYPIVVQAGRNLAGDSLGFHAYSLRLDNCTNQWYLEETSMAYIPPYSLGLCLRLYGTGVAILLNSAPIGQPQLAPIAGEQVIGVYSDQLRTEVAASPIRNFTLVQSVSDLTEGPQPALPPVGVDRLYADTSGNIHHLHSNGQDLTLVDPSNAGTLLYPSFDPHYQALMAATALGGDLYGTVSAGHIALQNNSVMYGADASGTLHQLIHVDTSNNTIYAAVGTNPVYWQSQGGAANLMSLTNAGTLTVLNGVLYLQDTYISRSAAQALTVGGTLQANYLYTTDGTNGIVQAQNGTLYIRAASGNAIVMDGAGGLNVSVGNGNFGGALSVAGAYIIANAGYISAHSYLQAQGSLLYMNNTGTAYMQWGSNQFAFTHPLNSPGISLTAAAPAVAGAVSFGSAWGQGNAAVSAVLGLVGGSAFGPINQGMGGWVRFTIGATACYFPYWV